MSTLSLLQAAFQGCRVFVTGHTGFKGSWLLALLHHLGAQVTGYALPPDDTQPLFHLLGGPDLCHHHEADLLDYDALRAALHRARPEVVIHLAAQSLVRRSYASPVDTFSVNSQGTLHLLEALRHYGEPCAVVVATTDKVYENPETGQPLLETDPLGGHDPYSASKAMAEIVCASYRRSFFAPDGHRIALATARAGNVIGGGDFSTDRILPDIARALAAGQQPLLRNPAAVRPWQHVLEPLTGYLQLAAALLRQPQDFAQAWNFGPDPADCLPVQQLADQAIAAWGSGSYHISPPNPNAPHEAGLLVLDASKAKNYLHWHPRWNAPQAIRHAVEWYRHHSVTPLTVRQLTFSQMQSYFAG